MKISSNFRGAWLDKRTLHEVAENWEEAEMKVRLSYPNDIITGFGLVKENILIQCKEDE